MNRKLTPKEANRKRLEKAQRDLRNFLGPLSAVLELIEEKINYEDIAEEVQEDKAPPFFTGSRVYGRPTKDSDLDIVMFLAPEQVKLLSSVADEVLEQEESETVDRAYGKLFSTSIRFGKLNIIAVQHRAVYNIWKRMTSRLEKKGPVSRDRACRYMAKLREKLAVELD